MKKKILSLSILLLSLSACVSNRVFNDLESRYAELKDNFNRQTKTIESLNEELKDLTEKYVTQEASLQQTEDSLNLKQQKLDQLESSLDLLKLQSESALKERITENEGLLKKIAERENELADRMARVEELEGLIARQNRPCGISRNAFRMPCLILRTRDSPWRQEMVKFMFLWKISFYLNREVGP